ncbi:copper transport protein ATOX1-like [Physeter macrocephalus]|uniref:Copper transport protein ATOX1 n=1 Tax=Physeter macrocephalus TaxID=9755 RepID=A0A455CBL6_PHYMC|nr:copper transport protein ATOX1-like [Physeter catodon]|eukprot:XP_028356646.1 copper transport protein ATOX1-like [Physeter catodon]
MLGVWSGVEKQGNYRKFTPVFVDDSSSHQNNQYAERGRHCQRHRHHFLSHAKAREFSVDMTCEGCSNAVTQVLNELGGVQFDIDLPNKKVCINSEHSMDTLLETLGKTGKAVSYPGSK